ncbi:hypothetical protein [Pelagibius sp.]|uniref:COG1470 family protein n=1 Tax=Pelagibius sp. TaxID=1931238 RepID=UPI00260C4EF5|nr:hypothetical protein [Pelagibius sp.]
MFRSPAVLASALILAATAAEADNHNQSGPTGSTFAVEVVEFSLGSPGPIKGGFDPASALGPPDYVDDDSVPTFVTLGCRGSIVLRLAGDGVVDREGPDLRTYEIGATSARSFEDHSIEISSDLETWYAVGVSQGGTAEFDIAEGAPSDRAYRYLRITDLGELCSGDWAGADIDAVEVLGSGTDATPAGVPADRAAFQPADSWLGKWSGVSSYNQTTDVWEWYFEVVRSCNDYGIRFGRRGPEYAEILRINASELEFLLHDDFETHLTMVRQRKDAYTGTVSQPNNKPLSLGRVDGQRIGEANAVPASAAQCDDAEGPDPYADEVIGWAFGSPRSSEGPSRPSFALGAPDYTGSHRDPGLMTLGCGGQLTVMFSDNDLVDGPGADLRIFEPGDREAYSVEVSVDGAEWQKLGRAEGGNSSFDLSAIAAGDEIFRFVRITDAKSFCEGARPGADIDAVEALNSAGDAPQEVAETDPGVVLSLEMSPLENIAGSGQGFTKEPMDLVVTVTNETEARLFNPRLKIELSGAAVAEANALKAEPAFPRKDEDAAFFDIVCDLRSVSAHCPLGYADRSEAGRTYLEPGEERAIVFEFTPQRTGPVTVTALAAATQGEGDKIEATDARTAEIVGPILGLRLVSTTPEPYGYSTDPRLPLHEGGEITLRYAIRNSAEGGSVEDLELSFFTRTGEVASVALPSGEAVPCGRPKVTDRRMADCVIGDLGPGDTVEVDATFTYGRRFMAEASISHDGSQLEHFYETGVDVDPVLTAAFSPPPAAAVGPGQEISARFEVKNRGRDRIGSATLKLEALNAGHEGFVIDRIDGCKAVNAQSGLTICELGAFSSAEPATVAVVLSPVPEAAVGARLGLAWTLEVPGHSFPYASTANDRGSERYRVAPRLADLFVAEYIPAYEAEPGIPEVMQIEVGNKGTWPAEDAALSLRVDVFDESGSRSSDSAHLLRAAALLSDPDDPADIRQVPCRVTANEATCDLGRLAPRNPASILFEWTSGAVNAGSYVYTAAVSEGLGERGDAALTKDNLLKGGAAIKATGKTLADLRVFNAQTVRDAQAGAPQSFDLWVENGGTIAQENVGLKLVLDVTARQAMETGVRYLKDAYAIVPNLDDGEKPLRRVPCVVVGETASCALGRLEAQDAAQVFFEWDPGPVMAGAYRYEAFINEGAGEAANKTLEDNKTSGGAAIVPARPGATARAVIEYPDHGADVRRGSAAYGSYDGLEAGSELWLFSFSPLPRWYHLRPIRLGEGARGSWSVQDLSYGRPGPADIGYVYRIGVVHADPGAAASLRENAARLKRLPDGATILHEVEVTRIGE